MLAEDTGTLKPMVVSAVTLLSSQMQVTLSDGRNTYMKAVEHLIRGELTGEGVCSLLTFPFGTDRPGPCGRAPGTLNSVLWLQSELLRCMTLEFS